MTQVFFHYSHSRGVMIDRRGAFVANLIEACEQATGLVRSLITGPNLEDWHGWVLHASDEAGEEIFVFPSHPCSAGRTERMPRHPSGRQRFLFRQ